MEENFFNPYYIIPLAFIPISSLLLLLLLSKKPKHHLPPGPPAFPIIGHLHLINPPPHHAFHHLSSLYGPLMHLRLGSTLSVVASSPDMAREVLKTHDAAIANRPVTFAARRFAYDSAGFAFAPAGPYWKFMRKLCMSELLGSRTVDQLLPVRRRELHRFLGKLAEASRTGEKVNVSWELIKMANSTVRRMIAGSTAAADDGEEAEETLELVKQVNVLVGAFNLGDLIGVFKRWDLQGLEKRIEEVHRRFDAMMERIIRRKEEVRRRRRKEAGEEVDGLAGAGVVKDLIDLMLDISEDEGAEMKLTRENIKSFVQDIFSAGSDSSAATLEWALSELINHPDMLTRAQCELDQVTGKSRLVEETDIPNLPYLHAIVKETLRLHPAAAFVLRQAIKDVQINGFDIPAGTNVYVNVWSVGRDPNYWEDPLEFKPERFLTDDKSLLDFRGQHFHYVPFGSGRRVCPGINLALQVIHSTLASLIQCFDWSGVGDGGKLDMTEGRGVVIPRAHPIACVPARRLDLLPLLES